MKSFYTSALLALLLISGAGTSFAKSFEIMDGHNATEMQLPTNWLACAQDSDCRIVHAGCVGSHVFAVNGQYENQARAAAFGHYGDPETAHCTANPPNQSEPPVYVAMCTAHGICTNYAQTASSFTKPYQHIR